MVNIDVGSALRSLLLSDEDLKQFCAGRIYSDFLPQSSPVPAITYRIISENPWESLSGPVCVDQASIQIDSYAENRPDSVLFASMVWQLAAGFSGVIDGVYLQAITRRSGVRYGIDRPLNATDTRRFYGSQDLLVTYNSGSSYGM